MKKLTSILFPVALLLGCASAQPLLAQTAPDNAASVAVDYADLDLSNPVDRARLQRRLEIAARQICGTGYSFDLEGQNAARDCFDLTLQSITLPGTSALASAE